MTKSELVSIISEKTNIARKEVESVVALVFGSIQKTLKSDKGRVEIRGFGTFSVKDYKGYKGRNPKTGETIEIKGKKLPVFRVGKELKDRINSIS